MRNEEITKTLIFLFSPSFNIIFETFGQWRPALVVSQRGSNYTCKIILFSMKLVSSPLQQSNFGD